ncbi:MAG TPA: hypothetical protein VGH27_11675 [Streptosporangiaceae bacterium]|jgi:hypothetical protein
MSWTSWLPSWDMITTRLLELRKRRGMMIVVVLLIVGVPVLVLGLRLAFHLFDPHKYGPAGTPGEFQTLSNPMAEFGFIMAVVVGTAAGSTDLTDGMFRHLVITGRSRLSLYLARVPAGLAILLPLVALAFTMVCLVTSFEGVPQPTTIFVDGASVPAHQDEAQLKQWLLQHPQQADNAFPVLAPGNGPARQPSLRTLVDQNIASFYSDYTSTQPGQFNPSINEMTKIGLWIELDIGIGFIVGLGLGSLMGQRTVSTIILVALEIIVTPILAATAIPYFLDGQRLDVGLALDQLRPAGLASGGGGGGPGHVIFGGRGSLGIPPMPTWAMVAVIVGWIIGWSAIGAWRMMTRDA